MTTSSESFLTEPDDTPVWFLDVDGVINAFPNASTIRTDEFAQYSKINASPDLWPDMSQDEVMEAKALSADGGRRYRITYRYELIKRMNELHHSGKVKIVWATTWGYGANGELAHRVGLKGPFESVGEPPAEAWTWTGAGPSTGARTQTWWKADAIVSYLRAHPEVKRIVWTDDDHDAWDTAYVVEGRESLVICPRPETGITDSEMDSIEEFLSD